MIDNVNKMSKYGLRREPTYDEIIGILDDSEKITGKLPNIMDPGRGVRGGGSSLLSYQGLLGVSV